GDDPVVNYIGIRGDEERKGYISHKPNIRARYPFVEDGITHEDVMRILHDSGLGLPAYYRWRSRSGCYFCFFQQRIEWVGLLENHPDLFEKAMAYEKVGPETGTAYFWNQGESLAELSRPERIQEIKADHHARQAQRNCARQRAPLSAVFGDDEEPEGGPCLVCFL
ncbi:MAG: phosphoadenosine phosphosulfate reductase, partial [Armatimonadota bacterium]|nr:phosphoadenosine phosphosulfate reductase [Armatimonadota bacterium]